MPEWGIALTGLVGVIIGALITGVIAWRIHASSTKLHISDNERDFRVKMLEKRLPIHQQAYSWWQNLNEVVENHEPQKIEKTAKEAHEWWDRNCLLLGITSRDEMVRLILLAHAHARGLDTREHIWEAFTKTKEAIIAGIGVEYLPEANEKPEVPKVTTKN